MGRIVAKAKEKQDAGFVAPPLADGLFLVGFCRGFAWLMRVLCAAGILVMAGAAVLFMPSIFGPRRECGFCRVESPAFGGALFCDATFRA